MRYQLLGGFRMSCGRSSCYQPLCFLPDVACAPQVGHLKATCKKGSGPAKSIKKTKSVKPEKRAPAVRILPIPACVCASLLFGVCVCAAPRSPGAACAMRHAEPSLLLTEPPIIGKCFDKCFDKHFDKCQTCQT